MSDKTRGGRRGLDQYVVFNVFIVVNEVLKDHRVSPMVVLVVKATVEPLRFLVLGHCQLVPAGREESKELQK